MKNKKNKKLTFEDYFTRRYGKRPAKLTEEAELRYLVAKGQEAQRILDECKRWDANRGAAVFGQSACLLSEKSA